MLIKKLWWVLKSIRFKIFFKKFGNLSYIAKPIGIINKGDIKIGSHVRIQPGLRIETISKNSIISIGDNTSIGQNLHITSGGNLKIGENCTILGNVFITNIDHDYQEIGEHILNQKHIIRETELGDNCFIGFGSAIQAGTKLGKQCVVGANAVVRGTFPDYCVLVGVPAKVIKRYDIEKKEWLRVN